MIPRSSKKSINIVLVLDFTFHTLDNVAECFPSALMFDATCLGHICITKPQSTLFANNVESGMKRIFTKKSYDQQITTYDCLMLRAWVIFVSLNPSLRYSQTTLNREWNEYSPRKVMISKSQHMNFYTLFIIHLSSSSLLDSSSTMKKVIHSCLFAASVYSIRCSQQVNSGYFLY